jgi:hypothetical protein
VVAGVLAHDDAGACVLPSPQHRAGAEVTVGDPQFARLRAVQQRRDRSTLDRVRVLAGHHIRDPAKVWIIHHQ